MARPNQLPDLIDKLRELVVGQYADADRAIIGLGDFALQKDYAKHRLTTDVWKTMPVDQRRKAVNACFKIPSSNATVTSTDSLLTVQATPGGGKKPHQTKRRRNERTTSRKKGHIKQSSICS